MGVCEVLAKDERWGDAGLIDDVGLTTVRGPSNDDPGVGKGGNVIGDGSGRAKKGGFGVARAIESGDVTTGADKGDGDEGLS